MKNKISTEAQAALEEGLPKVQMTEEAAKKILKGAYKAMLKSPNKKLRNSGELGLENLDMFTEGYVKFVNGEVDDCLNSEEK